MSQYANLSEAEIRQLLANPLIGDIARASLQKELGTRESRVADVIVQDFEPRGRHLMNKTERRYADLLDANLDVADWWYESVKLKLAPRTTYTPDFLVLYKDGHREIHEVKGGYIREDAILKFKLARVFHHWARFRMYQWKDNEWVEKYAA